MNRQFAARQLKKKIDLDNLPRMEARVEIAKDVLARLKLEKLIAQSGSYLESEVMPLEETTGRELGREPCTVCAVGGLFVSMAIRKNITFKMPHGGHSDLLVRELEKFFTREELASIEAAFENCCSPLADEYGYDVGDADDFCLGLAVDERLTKIMQGIIDHKGELPWK